MPATMSSIFSRMLQLLEHSTSRVQDGSARPKHIGYTLVFKGLNVLLRHHATYDDENIRASTLLQLEHELWHKRQMASGKRRDSNDVHIAFNRVPRYFFRRQKERADINVEPQIRKCSGDYFCASIVAILS